MEYKYKLKKDVIIHVWHTPMVASTVTHTGRAHNQRTCLRKCMQVVITNYN